MTDTEGVLTHIADLKVDDCLHFPSGREWKRYNTVLRCRTARLIAAEPMDFSTGMEWELFLLPTNAKPEQEASRFTVREAIAPLFIVLSRAA